MERVRVSGKSATRNQGRSWLVLLSEEWLSYRQYQEGVASGK
jgi:hypothetical protein